MSTKFCKYCSLAILVLLSNVAEGTGKDEVKKLLFISNFLMSGYPQERERRQSDGESSCPQIEILRGRDGRDGRDGACGPPGEKGEQGEREERDHKDH